VDEGEWDPARCHLDTGAVPRVTATVSTAVDMGARHEGSCMAEEYGMGVYIYGESIGREPVMYVVIYWTGYEDIDEDNIMLFNSKELAEKYRKNHHEPQNCSVYPVQEG